MRPLYGVALKLISTIVFAVMLVFIKWVGDRVPPGEVVFFRSLFGAVPVLVMEALAGNLVGSFYTARPIGHVLRSSFGVGSMFLGFAAYQHLPIADVLAIGYAAPLLTVIVAALTLGEQVRIYRWSAVAIGLCGVVVILWPHLSDIGKVRTDAAAFGALLAFLSTFFTALAGTQVRRLTLMQEHPSTIVVYFSLGCALISFVTLPFGWVLPSLSDAMMLVGAGLVGGVGQILITRAYQHADASLVAPLEYVSILWAVLLGWWFFGDLPGVYVIVGSAIVITSGVVIVLRERQLGLKRDAQEQAGRL